MSFGISSEEIVVFKWIKYLQQHTTCFRIHFINLPVQPTRSHVFILHFWTVHNPISFLPSFIYYFHNPEWSFNTFVKIQQMLFSSYKLIIIPSTQYKICFHFHRWNLSPRIFLFQCNMISSKGSQRIHI